jgi:hypothetical protein
MKERVMKVRYDKWHNNYPFVLDEEYEALPYKQGWLLIEGQLYREEFFVEKGEEYNGSYI